MAFCDADCWSTIMTFSDNVVSLDAYVHIIDSTYVNRFNPIDLSDLV